jgi:hypothetical protein
MHPRGVRGREASSAKVTSRTQCKPYRGALVLAAALLWLADCSGVVAGVLGVVQAFGELRPALVRRGANSMSMAALSTTFELALLERVKNFSFRGCIRRPMEILLGRRYRRTRRAAASRGGCPSTADDEEKKLPTPFHF